MHDVSIIGAGISGLSAAIALRKFPLRVKIFEKNNTFSTLGAGIQLGPNGSRTLSSLGLLDEVLTKSAQPEHLLVYDINSNKSLCKMELGSNVIKKYGFPYLTILRSDLHCTLEKKLLNQQNIEIVKGFQINDLKVDKNKVSIFDDKGKKYDSHALIGSDGIHSIIRKIQFKKNTIGENQSTAYRTLIKNDCKKINKNFKNITIWFGNSFHAITYPVGIDNDINVVVVTKQIHNCNYGWSNPCHFDEFFSFFKPFPNREITKLISTNSEWFKWPIYQCNPVKTINEMTKNSIILLGDAAHYTKPHLAQGACMALEDSNQLSCFLEKTNFKKQIRWEKVFIAVSKKRIKRISKVQKKSTQNGYIFQWSGILRLLRNLILKIFGHLIIDPKWLFK